MKKVAKSLVVVGALMTAAGAAGADMMFGDFNPYVGADYYHAWMKGKSSWNQIFPKSYPGATIYIGNKFTETFGLELGGDWSARAKKDWTISNGTTFFTTRASSTFTGTTKIRRAGWHLDLVGFLPLNDCANLFASVGYGWVHTKIDQTFSVTPGTGASANLTSAIASTSGKGRSVLRVGAGADWMVTDMVGLRAKLGWESTGTLRVKGNTSFTNFGFDQKAFKSSVTGAVGAFVKF